MREDEVFFYTKEWVLSQDFRILGGQSPNGTERFPVIEIKSESNVQKGSRASYKPDMVIATENFLIVIECKPVFSVNDVAKLREISQSGKRMGSLVSELRQRRSMERHQLSLAQLTDDQLIRRARFCVAYAGEHHPIPNMYSLVFNSDGSAVSLFHGEASADSFDR